MQEETVGWDPISVCRYPPWQEKLFVLYNLIVLGFAIIRCVGLIRSLWFGGVLAKPKEAAAGRFRFEWAICKAKVDGLKRLCWFTLLVTLTFFADRATNLLAEVAREKRVWIAAVYGGLAELGAQVALGALVGTVLFGLASFCEGVLARRLAYRRFMKANAGGHQE